MHRLTLTWGIEFLIRIVTHCPDSDMSLCCKHPCNGVLSWMGWDSPHCHSDEFLSSRWPVILNRPLQPTHDTWIMHKRLSYMVIPAYTGTVSRDYLKMLMYSLINSFNYIRNSWESPWDCQILCSGSQSAHLNLKTVSINRSVYSNGNLWEPLLCCEAGIAESWSQIPGIFSGRKTANSVEKK